MFQKVRFPKAFYVLLAAIAVSPLTYAQKTETGFLDRSIRMNGTEYRYQVFVPRGFTRKRTWPVIVALHGGGEYGSDGVRQTTVGLAPAIRRNVERFPAIIIFPQAKVDGKPGWQLDGGEAALRQLDKTIREFHGDPKRVILTGYSAGGNGTWSLASRYPDRFAGLVVVCGFVDEFRGRASNILYPALASGSDPYATIARRVASIPVRIFHGAKDDVVLPEQSRRMFAALKAAGADVEYTEFPETNHNAWDPAYSRGDVIEWMLRQRRL